MPDSVSDKYRRESLAAFLRARRDELQPEDVGIERRGRRRVTGLRRHEVADRAAVSVTWYTWLEQSRDINVSALALDSLARALELDDEAWRYLRRLGGAPVVEPDPPVTAAEVDEALIEFLSALGPMPASITTGPFDVLHWNDAYAALFGDPGRLEPDRRNALWVFFMDERVRSCIRDWEVETGLAAARLRAEAGKYQGNKRFEEIIEALTENSEHFVECWASWQVERFAHHVQTFDDPEVGVIRAALVQFRPIHQPALTVMIHRPVDDESTDRISQLMDRMGASAELSHS